MTSQTSQIEAEGSSSDRRYGYFYLVEIAEREMGIEGGQGGGSSCRWRRFLLISSR